MKKIFRIMLLVLLIFSCLSCANNEKDYNNAISPLKINFLKVGKADAIVISQDEHAILIDSGEDDDATKIIEHLKQNNIKSIDALIITHFDKDHVGAADKIIDQYQINNIYVPDYIGHHNEYLEFIDSLKRNNLSATIVDKDLEFNFNDAHFLIEATKLFNNQNHNKENDNNHSLIISIKHGNLNLLFMGDAENERLEEWLSQNDHQNYDLIKMPHHGIYDKSLKTLINLTNPKYAIITDSKKNPASEKTIDILNQNHSLIFNTKDKAIEAISDGLNIDVHYKGAIE